jgi:tetratricopeptide (TPR) repeat protein
LVVLATAVQKWTLAGLIGMIACFVVPAAADDGEACVRGSGDTAIEACTRLIKSGRYDKRNLALIYSSRANQWERKGDFDKAMRDHGEAIRTDPTYASGYMHRGNAYARRGDYDRAIADYTKAIRLDPIYANGFYNRGLTYSRQGDHKRAIADFTAGIDLDGNSSQLWGQRCWSRAVIGKQLQEAVDDRTKASSLAPKIPQVFAYRGFAYLKLGQFDKVLADYDAAFALTKNPDHADWLYVRGVTKLKKGDIAGGNADIASAKAMRADIAERSAADCAREPQRRAHAAFGMDRRR